MNSIKVLLILLLASFIYEKKALAMPASKNIIWEVKRDNFAKNLCGAPKPQLYYIGTIEETANYADEHLEPSAVVVNRCSEFTGCCEGDRKCVTATEETVLYALRIVGTESEVNVPIKNDITCKCV